MVKRFWKKSSCEPPGMNVIENEWNSYVHVQMPINPLCLRASTRLRRQRKHWRVEGVPRGSGGRFPLPPRARIPNGERRRRTSWDPRLYFIYRRRTTITVMRPLIIGRIKMSRVAADRKMSPEKVLIARTNGSDIVA